MMPIDQTHLSFQEFSAKANELIERIKQQNPLAIIQFGSSLFEEDYIPGLSDIDAYVISDEPLEGLEGSDNEVGFEYYHTTPNQFILEISQGASFALCAIRSGKAVYDPHGFVASIYALGERGLKFAPTALTLRSCGRGIGNQLSSAINLYLLRPASAETGRLLFKNLHKVTTTASMIRLILDANAFVTGYTAVREALLEIESELVKPLDATRRSIFEPPKFAPREESPTSIRSDDVCGAAILEAEELYDAGAGHTGVAVRVKTNDLITAYESEYGKLDRVHAVRINNIDLTHLVLGERRGNLHLFGFQIKNGRSIRVVEPVLPEKGEAVLKKLRILR